MCFVSHFVSTPICTLIFWEKFSVFEALIPHSANRTRNRCILYKVLTRYKSIVNDVSSSLFVLFAGLQEDGRT